MHCVILRHLLSLPLYLGVMVGEMLLEISHGPFGFISKKVLISPYLFSFRPHHFATDLTLGRYTSMIGAPKLLMHVKKTNQGITLHIVDHGTSYKKKITIR